MTTSNSDPHLSQEINLRTGDTEFAERVRLNQQKLRAALKPHYDFIVCGSGSSGSVVARRLAENLDVSVLLIEAGGTDDVPNNRTSVRPRQRLITTAASAAVATIVGSAVVLN